MPPTPQPRTAVVYDAHEYSPVSKAEDPHGHGADCKCSPVCVCGSGKDAFIHHKEAAAVGATVVQVEATDSASGSEKAASGKSG
jgi:hypothetical protein